MNIAEEVSAAKKAYADEIYLGGTRSPFSTCAVIGFESGFERGAEWARKQSLEEAAETIWDLWPDGSGREGLEETLRALAEGDGK